MNKIAKIASGIIGLSAICGLSAMASRTEIVTEQTVETIYYQTQTEYDDTQRDGTRTVKQEGKNGSKTAIYEITKNYLGREIRRKLIETKVDEAAQDEIIIVGTKKYYTCSNGAEYDNLTAKDECEKRISWEATKTQALQKCNADPNKINCWFDAYPGTGIHWSEPQRNTYTPAPSPSSHRSGAICRDGWRSSATGRGACSHHGGVAYWI